MAFSVDGLAVGRRIVVRLVLARLSRIWRETRSPSGNISGAVFEIQGAMVLNCGFSPTRREKTHVGGNGLTQQSPTGS